MLKGAMKPETLQKAGVAMAAGAAWFAGEILAKSIILPAAAKLPEAGRTLKQKADQIKILTTVLVIPAMKEKASSLFSFGKGKMQETASTVGKNITTILPKRKVAMPPKTAVEPEPEITDLIGATEPLMPPHGVAPGIPEEELL